MKVGDKVWYQEDVRGIIEEIYPGIVMAVKNIGVRLESSQYILVSEHELEERTAENDNQFDRG